MTDEEQFIAAIHAAPREDTLRLVYADWLDERGADGDADRAAFIRLSVAQPDELHWIGPWARSVRPQGASRILVANWRRWRDEAAARLGPSPLTKWLLKEDTAPNQWPDCRWAYRRGFASLFEGTQQVLLDAWDDLFKVGPIDEVSVRRLWHFGTISSLKLFLDRPSLRVLSLEAGEIRPDCVERLQSSADWFRRLEKVRLTVSAGFERSQPGAELRAWLAAQPALRHVTFGSGLGPT